MSSVGIIGTSVYNRWVLIYEEQVTLLTVLDYCNIIRNMSLHDTRRTNFVLSELLIWTKYLQYALQRMYEVANEMMRRRKR